MIASLSPASLVTLLLWQKRFGVEPAHIGFGWQRLHLDERATLSVVPAKAGTHNHRRLEISLAVPHREETEYGSPLSRGRQRIGCAPQRRFLVPEHHTSDGGACLTPLAPILAVLAAVLW